MHAPASNTDFGEKYRNKNPLAQYLINNFYRTLEKLIKGTSPASILEVGCGEGYSTNRIINMLGSPVNYVAVDIEPHLLSETQKRNPKIDVQCASILELPYADKSFDLVICLEVLEHLDAPASGLRELCRVSKNHLLLSVPHEPFFRIAQMLRGKNLNRLGNDEDHKQNWSRRTFKAFLKGQVNIAEHLQPFPWQQILGSVRRN